MAAGRSILAVDLGGTHVRAALGHDAPPRLGPVRLAETAALEDLSAWLVAACQEPGWPPPQRCEIAVAGPVEGGRRVRMTNAALNLDAVELEARLGMPVQLVNDFSAVAMSLPVLGAEDCEILGSGDAVAGAAMAVLGPGTGLGVSGLVPAERGWAVISGEGGHQSLAVGTGSAERQALDAIGGGNPVAAEEVLSGAGLQRLHRVLGGQSLASPGEVAARAFARDDPAAVAAMRLFTLWLGRFAGDLALLLGARGGVYLAGGILPRWREHFDRALFRQGFEDKGDYQDYLRQIPVRLIIHPQPALLGLIAGPAARVDTPRTPD